MVALHPFSEKVPNIIENVKTDKRIIYKKVIRIGIKKINEE